MAVMMSECFDWINDGFQEVVQVEALHQSEISGRNGLLVKACDYFKSFPRIDP